MLFVLGPCLLETHGLLPSPTEQPLTPHSILLYGKQKNSPLRGEFRNKTIVTRMGLEPMTLTLKVLCSTN